MGDSILGQEQVPQGKINHCPYCGSGNHVLYLRLLKTKEDTRFIKRCKECNKEYYECHAGNYHWTEGRIIEF